MTIRDSIQRLKTDHEIHKDVRDELRWDPNITNKSAVDISVTNGIVMLQGTADSIVVWFRASASFLIPADPETQWTWVARDPLA